MLDTLDTTSTQANHTENGSAPPNGKRTDETIALEPGEDSGYSLDDIQRGERLHELIDRKFLKILTEVEARELNELLAWRSKLKSEFYRNIPLAQE